MTIKKTIPKKENKVINFNPKNRTPLMFIKGTTAQCKSALAYNDLIKKFKLESKIEPIFSGSKIKWIYMRENPYNINCLAFKADGTDPKEIMDLINVYIDRKMVYEKELKNKLISFYDVLKWTFPNQCDEKSKQFFD